MSKLAVKKEKKDLKVQKTKLQSLGKKAAGKSTLSEKSAEKLAKRAKKLLARKDAEQRVAKAPKVASAQKRAQASTKKVNVMKSTVSSKSSAMPASKIPDVFKQATLSKAMENLSQSLCREPACENIVIGAGYCRLHYIKNWQRIKRKDAILQDGRLQQYIQELTSKYSEKYLEAIRHDLMTDDTFLKVITELDLHEPEDDIGDMDAASGMEEYPLESVRGDMDGRDDEF